MKPDFSPPSDLQLSPRPLARRLLPRRRKSLALFSAITVLIGSGLVWQTWQTRHNVAIGQQQPQGVPVKLETLETVGITISSDFVGSLEAEQAVEIRPEVTGRIKRLLVKAGDRVSAGQRLAELQPDQERANLAGVLATVTAAQANRANFQANITAARADQAGLRASVTAAQANRSNFQANITAARANQASLQANVNAALAGRYNARFQLDALQEELIARFADAELAYKNYARIEFLVDEGVLSDQELDQAQRERDVANADLRALRQRVEAARASLFEADTNVTQAQANLAQAASGVEQAQAQLAQAQAGVEQAQAQLTQGKAGVEQATAQLDQAQAGFKQAQAESDRAQAQLRETAITAPFAGVIGDIPVRVGSVVANDDTLTTLTQNNLLSLRISVPSERSPELRIGQFVELVTEEGNILNTGQISFISPDIDPSRQTVLAKATFSNPSGVLRNGQFVRARLIWRSQPGLSVPAIAITRLAGEPFVFIATEPGPDDDVPPGTQLIAKQRLVELGKLQNNRYQVKSGLSVGDQIIVSGVQNLTNGAPIQVLPEETPDDEFAAPAS